MSQVVGGIVDPIIGTDISGQKAAKKAQEAADAAALSERKARGRASTILTGGKGLLGPATTSRRTLLGS